MRAELRAGHVPVAPGGTAILEIDVRNDGEVIEGISAQVIGVDPGWVRTDPHQLALFPDSTGTITIEIDLPAELPAGRMPVTIEVRSSVDPHEVAHFDAALEIAPAVRAQLALEPSSVDGYREALGTVVIDNRGNAPLELALTGDDPERAITFAFDPPVLVAGPGERVAADVLVRAPRRLVGSPLIRPFAVHGSGGGTALQATGTFAQRAMVPRGVATSGIIAAIIAIWALAAFLAINMALSSDDLAKSAPASFFAPGIGSSDGAVAATKGLDPRTVGGELTGTVLASTDGRGIPRMSVEAVRQTRQGPVLASASATGDDGEFAITGLLPGSYQLRFTAPGFDEAWYPGVSSPAAAETVTVGSEEAAPLTLELEGQPGSLSGRVDVGDSGADVPVAITLRPVVGGVRGDALRVGTTGADGTYSIAPVPTPAAYELTFDAPGFQPLSVIEDLDGGEQAVLNTVRLSSGLGSISGLVTSGGQPLGGVTVTATSAGEEYVTATPTSGAVGSYLLAELPTPATYLLTFEREGFGSETIAVELGPGADRTGLDIALSGGTGTITGKVTRANGQGLGDVEVTVSGEGTMATAATLTTGDVGAWRVTGLPTPGRYTVTFSLDGFRSETRAVELGPAGAASGIDAVLTSTLGSIGGTVTGDGGTGLAGAEVEVSDGETIRITQTADTPRGQFRLTDLPPGAYSVTFRRDGYVSSTVLVDLRPGASETVNVRLRRPG